MLTRVGFVSKLLTVTEVADMLRVSKMTIYRLLKNGSLNGSRVGRGYRIDKANVEEYLNKNKC